MSEAEASTHSPVHGLEESRRDTLRPEWWAASTLVPGRFLEVRRGLTWGPVCDADLHQATAYVVSQEAQCRVPVSVQGRLLRPGLWACVDGGLPLGGQVPAVPLPLGPGHQCGHGQDSGLRCSGEKILACVNHP
ncbi:hypothetical protein HPG69_010790 [Diceros bicornis minor]|uniref:Uncharacterized protein n=1 Tax=Diceros bicornis minor TaxID=77932 RepID=A0A7J7F6D0_DICBM|nr:hypothetical protein HPG69_010790 [Diceros bicornis minor]